MSGFPVPLPRVPQPKPKAKGSASPSQKGAQKLVAQPPFAAQIRNLPRALGTDVPLQRGYMIWARPMTTVYGSNGGPLGDGRDMINFLFNPSTVTASYSLSSASLQAAMMYTVPGDQGNLLAPVLQQTVSWSLYFDRTYELNYGGASQAVNDPAVIGVQSDVYQFMQFTGVLARLNAGQAAAIQGSTVGSKTAGTAQAITTGGIMMLVPCHVFFGNALQQMNSNPHSTNFNAVSSQVSYYGFISGWSITYTHWTSNMVPMRGVIDVNFTMLPALASGDPNAQAVWRDLYKLGKSPSTVPVPYNPGVVPPVPPLWVIG